MTVTTTTVSDDATSTVFKDVDDVAKTVGLRTVWKSGSDVFGYQTIVSRAQNAVASNDTYLAIVSPTNAQVVSQVQLLTRECNGIIRLLLGLLSSTSDT